MRAEWRRGPLDDRPFPVRVWGRVRQALRARWPETLALSGGSIVAIVFHIRYAGLSPSMLLLVPPIVAIQWLWFAEQAPLPVDVSSLADEPSKLPQIPVDIEIAREGVRFGSDSGMLSSLEGWLVFSGFETEFSLSNGTTCVIDQESEIGGSDATGIELSDGTLIRLRTRSPIWRVRDLIREWHRSPERAVGIERLPPSKAQPEALTLIQLAFARTLVVATVGSLALAVWSWDLSHSAPTLVICAVVPFILLSLNLMKIHYAMSILQRSLREVESPVPFEMRTESLRRDRLRHPVIETPDRPSGRRYGVWSSDRSKIRGLSDRRVHAAVSLGLIMVALAVLASEIPGVLFHLVLLVVAGLLSTKWLEPPIQSSRRDLGVLADDPPAVHQYETEILIFRRGVLIGADRGLVSFVEGWLVFEGFESSFQLPWQDCRRVGRLYRHTGVRELPKHCGLNVAIAGTDLEMVFDHRSVPWSGYVQLREWFSSGTEQAVGVPLLPPNTPQGRLRSVIVGRRWSLLAKLLLGVAIGAFWMSLAWREQAAGFGLLVLYALWPISSCWTQLGKLREWERALAGFQQEIEAPSVDQPIESHLRARS